MSGKLCPPGARNPGHGELAGPGKSLPGSVPSTVVAVVLSLAGLAVTAAELNRRRFVFAVVLFVLFAIAAAIVAAVPRRHRYPWLIPVLVVLLLAGLGGAVWYFSKSDGITIVGPIESPYPPATVCCTLPASPSASSTPPTRTPTLRPTPTTPPLRQTPTSSSACSGKRELASGPVTYTVVPAIWPPTSDVAAPSPGERPGSECHHSGLCAQDR